MLELYAIKTDENVALADRSEVERGGPFYSCDKSLLFKYLFDGNPPESTFDKTWVTIDAMPQRVQRIIPETVNIIGFALKPEFSATELTPERVDREFFSDDANEGYRGLYEAEYETISEQYEDTEFTVTVLATVDDLSSLRGLKFNVRDRSYPNSQPRYDITEESAQHQLADKIFFPKILLAARPCKLSSVASYEIIRNHVKDNIDGRYAQITSDYDFCFTVQKRIKLTDPIVYTVDKGTKRKPNLVKEYQHIRKVDVYRIAPRKKGEVYNNYPECPQFEGEDYRELEHNIKQYLDSIMVEINAPLVECSCCKGQGVVAEQDAA